MLLELLYKIYIVLLHLNIVSTFLSEGLTVWNLMEKIGTSLNSQFVKFVGFLVKKEELLHFLMHYAFYIMHCLKPNSIPPEFGSN